MRERSNPSRDGLAIAERLGAVRREQYRMAARSEAFSYDNVGDALEKRKATLRGALKSYPRRARNLPSVWAHSNSGNTDWQRGLSVSYNEVGDVLEAKGDLTGALKSYRDSLAIRERRAQSNPSNTQWQRDLVVSYNNVGGVLKALGDLTGALKSYRDSLAITLRLVSLDRSNTEWQQDLQFVIGRIGGLACRFLLAHDFATALVAADQAISLNAPDKIWLYSNRAHALMFLGHIDDARDIYLKYHGKKNTEGGKSWETIVLEDFEEFRKARLINPLMNEIEKEFKSGE